MKRKLSLLVSFTAFALLLIVIGPVAAQAPAAAPQAAKAAAPSAAKPAFQVDPFWPKPLPNHWIIGSVTGVAVDSRDHVWILQNGANSMTQPTEMGTGTNPPTAERCCSAAPPVLEFDAGGALVNNWGGSADGVPWPRCVQGIAIDPKGNIWIGGNSLETKGNPPRACQFGTGGGSSPVPASAFVQSFVPTAPARGAAGGGAAAAGRGAAAGGAAAGRGGAAAAPAPAAAARGGRGAPPATGPVDAMVLKFSPAGKLLTQIGAPGKVEGPSSTAALNRPTAMDFDAAANEIYIADTGNRRIAVFDMDTGAYKRHWGAYGNKPDVSDLGPYESGMAPAPQFRYVSCVHIAKDGMVYVCDKIGDRIQVFQKDGKFVKEVLISNQTMGGTENGGSVWDLAFSKDPQQRYLYVADGTDKKILVVARNTLLVVDTFGQGGRLPGEFVGVGSLAVDSKGNLFTGETFEGKRVQRWALK
jgi:DNA-binding beta-propeller fold protein YncE